MSRLAVSLRKLSFVFVSAGFAAMTTGCSNMATTAHDLGSTAAITGTIHGGNNPIIGATVKLYSTGTTGYGAGATLLATTTSGSLGGFTFPANTCVAGSEVYAVAAGGTTGANAANLNSLLVAALGDCSTVSASTQIFLSEMTTVAAAYALSNFTTISGTGAASVVTIGAPTTNATSTPSCSGTGAAMTCTAAGLKHAFANALNLASSVSTTASGSPTGNAYTTAPSNLGSTVPTILLNTIADITQSCVNSVGGVSGDGSGCGTLFANTTPPTTSTASPVTPTNTLQALINLAKYPTMTAAQVTALFGLPSAQAFYQPSLTAAPHDFSVAIYYKNVTIGGTATTFGYPYFVALDYNDNVYAVDMVTSSAGPVTLVGMSANGTPLYAGGTISTTVCAAGVPCVSAPDTNGTLWVANGSTTVGNLYPVSTSTGLTGTPLPAGTGPVFGVAVDKFNTVFTSVPTAAAANSLYSVASGGTALAPVLGGGAAISETLVPAFLTIDGSGNLWNANKYTASTTASTTYLPNTGTTSTVLGAPVQTVDDSTTTRGGAYGVVVDSSGNGFTNNLTYLYKATAGNTTITAIPIISGTVSAVGARYSTIDGANNIYMPDNNGTSASYLWQYLPATGSFVNLLPCASGTGTTICSVTAATETIDGPRNAQVDSTGSVWIASSTNGNIVQVIGTAAPAWPQLSYGHPGVKP